jgi:hypothetical protein
MSPSALQILIYLSIFIASFFIFFFGSEEQRALKTGKRQTKMKNKEMYFQEV